MRIQSFKNIIPILLLGILSCKQEVPIHKLSASFQVKEVIYAIGLDENEVNDTDSVSTPAVSFEATEPENSSINYEWKIGTDARIFRTRKVELNFNNSPTNEIDVTLTVLKTELDGTQQKINSSRKVYLRKPSLVPGVYRGVFHQRNGDDSATVVIQKDFIFPGYDEINRPYYKGTLISSTNSYYDTIFIGNQEHAQIFLNKKFICNSANAMFPITEINKNTQNHIGCISLNTTVTDLIKIELTAEDSKSNNPVQIFFEGKRVN